MVRINKLNELLNVITDQAIDRFSKRPDQISNAEFLKGIQVLQEAIYLILATTTYLTHLKKKTSSTTKYIKYQNKGWKLMDEMEVGYINKDEYNNAKDGKKFETKKFEELDFNKDGRLTKGEYELNQKVDFAKGDKNGDAKLSEYEYISAKKAELKYNFKEKTPQGSVKEKYKYKVNE